LVGLGATPGTLNQSLLSRQENDMAQRRIWYLYPVLILAWLLHALSEWSYDAAAWLYKRCGTTIFDASVTWEDK
jgi:hypothetical protein